MTAVEPMHTTREAIVVHAADGRPVIDLDPIEVANNGDVASVWDTRLHDLAAAAHAYATPDMPVRLVWSDTHRDVLGECPVCDCIKPLITYASPEDADDDCMVCRDCV